MRHFLKIVFGKVSQKYRVKVFNSERKYYWGIDTYEQDSKVGLPKLIDENDHVPILYPNHTLYELNPKTGEIFVAQTEMRPLAIFDKGDIVWKEMVIRKPKHLYASGLNVESAKREFRKQLDKLGALKKQP